MEYIVNCEESIQDAFLEYGAAVAQERSIIDVRDGLKTGLRQTLYAQYTNKLTHKNNFKKAQKSVAAAMSQSYTHGDMSCYSALVRAAKPWAYRYPLEEAQGSYGTQCGPDTESASRYVEMRSSELADILFDGLKKHTIAQWYKNYDDTEDIPSVFPSIGFWNIVNGTTGIAVAMATSVPQFNLKEVNDALIKLIKNPDIDVSKIYCIPDFSSGGYIINAAETKESICNGTGKSIRLRAKIEYDKKLHALKATELPYGVYTDTIIEQISQAVDKDENYGIEKVVDHTKQWADIWIYLSKEAIPEIVEKKLYKDTSLESFFSVNMIMLDKGCYPKVFGWKAACQAYIDHIKECKIRELTFDMDELIARNHILDGILIAIANIEEVIQLIKNSSTAIEAKENLISNYNLDEIQAKAILDLKLQRLANLEGIKVNQEKLDNCIKIDELNSILSSTDKINQILIDALNEVSNKFGDNRRTKVLNILNAEEEEKQESPVLVRIYDGYISIVNKMLTGKIINSTTLDTLIGIDSNGKFKKFLVSDIPQLNKRGISEKTAFGYSPIEIFSLRELKQYNFLLFITENGYIKKVPTTEFSFGRNNSSITKLQKDDKLRAVIELNEDIDIVYYTNNTFYEYNTKNLNPSTKNVLGTRIKEKSKITRIEVK